MSSKLVVQVEPERLELRLRGVSALAAGTVYAPVVLEGARGAVAPALRLFRDETCADAVAWTSEPASPVPHHSRLMSFPSLRLDTEATLGWFSDVRDAKSLPSSARVWGWLVAVDMGNGSDVGPVVLGASRVPVLLHDFSPVETDPGESWSAVLAELVADAIAGSPVDPTLGTRVSALEANTYTKAEVDAIVAALKTGSRQIVASLSDVTSPQPLVIYMVAKSAAQTRNAYDEYIWVEAGGAGRWEKIGDTEIDLSDYVKKEAGKGLFSGAYADLTGKPTLEDTIVRTSSNAVKSGGIWSAIWGALTALPTGFTALYDWCVAQLAAKASAADLRYALVTPVVEAVRRTLPANCLPVTFTYEGVSYSADALVEESEASAVGDMFLSAYVDGYSLGMVVAPASGDEKAEVIEVATFRADGVYESGVEGLQFGGVSPVADTSPTLAAELSVALDGRAGNSVVAPPSTTTATLTLPAAVPGHMRDLIADVDNSANSSDLGVEFASDAIAYIDAGGARFLLSVVDGDDLADLTTVEAGARARLYITETAQTATPTGGTEAVPVISLQRLTITVGGAA